MSTHPYTGLTGIITDGKDEGTVVTILGISATYEEFTDGIGQYPVFIVLMPDGTHATPPVGSVSVDPQKARRHLNRGTRTYTDVLGDPMARLEHRIFGVHK